MDLLKFITGKDSYQRFEEKELKKCYTYIGAGKDATEEEIRSKIIAFTKDKDRFDK